MEQSKAWISSRVSAITMSAIKEMAVRSAEVEGAASLTWGVPSFPTPDHIRAAVSRQLESDPEIGKYSLPGGLAELRQAVAETHMTATGIEVDPDRNVLITAGNIQGLNSLFHTILDEGDEVIVTDPGFASHIQQIELCGGVPVYWAMDEAAGWRLDVDALPALINDRTKAIVLISPSNPTGRIFGEDELRHIGALAKARGVLIMIDDPYSHFTYGEDVSCFNLASVPELAGNLAYLFTFSKAYAMSGWRAGYMVVPEHIKREALKVQDATIICPPRISQVAALSALTTAPVHLPGFRQAFARRCALICERLDRVAHVFSYAAPEGAYYVFPRILANHEDSLEFALRLLQDARVTVTPGRAFGPAGEHHVRMAFCMDDDIIETAFDRIEDYFGV
jgi:aspartate/methionine/tyrosine aminotransferase